MRFSMQIHDVEVPVAPGAIDDARVSQLDEDFETIHEQLFGKGSGFRAGGIDLTAFQVRATARTTKPDLAAEETDGTSSGTRDVYWPELRTHVATPIFPKAPAGKLLGPALIELPDTVIVVRPGQSGAPDPAGNYVIDLKS